MTAMFEHLLLWLYWYTTNHPHWDLYGLPQTYNLLIAQYALGYSENQIF